MQLALSTTIAPPPVPVWGGLSGNLRQGFTTKNQGWNPGPNVVNSTTAIGFWPSSFLEGVRQSHSARYYNPLTGRFMSRDPAKGDYSNPVTLHGYLYANGDPVNLKDPTGKEAAVATGLLDLRALAATAGLIAEARAISCTLMLAASELDAYVLQYEITGIDWVSCSAKVKKRWKCSAYCHVVDYSTGNTIIGPSSLGFGNSETEACQAAQDNAKALTPRGSYPRHCRCDQCTRM